MAAKFDITVKLGILIIIKQYSLLMQLRSIYEGAGYKVFISTNVADGINKLYMCHPNLLVIEQDLLRQNGKRVFDWLLSKLDVPIIALGSEGEEAVVALEAGADACLGYKFNVQELLARTRSLLLRKKKYGMKMTLHREETPNLSSEDLPLNLGNISNTEFRLLSCLLSNEEKVVHSNQLIHDVWGSKAASKACLRFYVRQLRQKMAGLPGNQGRILTERGIGYRYSKQNFFG